MNSNKNDDKNVAHSRGLLHCTGGVEHPQGQQVPAVQAVTSHRYKFLTLMDNAMDFAHARNPSTQRIMELKPLCAGPNQIDVLLDIFVVVVTKMHLSVI